MSNIKGKAKYFIEEIPPALWVILDPVLAVFKFWFHEIFAVIQTINITSEFCNFMKFLLQEYIIFLIFETKISWILHNRVNIRSSNSTKAASIYSKLVIFFKACSLPNGGSFWILLCCCCFNKVFRITSFSSLNLLILTLDELYWANLGGGNDANIIAKKLFNDSIKVSCQCLEKKFTKVGLFSGFDKKGRANHSFQSDWPCNSGDIFSKKSLTFSEFLFWIQLTR